MSLSLIKDRSYRVGQMVKKKFRICSIVLLQQMVTFKKGKHCLDEKTTYVFQVKIGKEIVYKSLSSRAGALSK